jgi:hypothetical protein
MSEVGVLAQSGISRDIYHFGATLALTTKSNSHTYTCVMT